MNNLFACLFCIIKPILRFTTSSVEDGYIKREGFWGLRALNNHREHVIAWLGDLKTLPHKEQTHWRAFNLTPSTRKISHTDFTRNIEGHFADPEHPELYFKYKFEKCKYPS